MYFKNERECVECGERFWGTAGANFCSSPCRSRNWRRARAKDNSWVLTELCGELVRRTNRGSAAYSKLLIRLLRAVAGELRSRGWDPKELLAGTPDEPTTEHDSSPGGIEGKSPHRVKWVHSPALELELLDEAIERRQAAGMPATWHEARRERLLKSLNSTSAPPSERKGD